MKNLLQSVSRCAAWSAGWTIAQPMRPPLLRKAILTRSFFLALMVMTVVTPMLGQALPAAEAAPISTGFALPRTAGTLNYAVSGSEEATWGYYGNQGAYAATNLSGDVAFITNSKLYPFSLVFSGGRSWSSSGQPSYGYSSLGLSQVLNLKRWTVVISDSISYLPGTPTVGLSGVPGAGDLGINPVQVGADTGQGVLTAYSNRVANTVVGSIQRQLTGRTSFNVSGSYGITRFLGSGGGLDGGSVTGGVGISHQLSAVMSVGGNYSYSTFTYHDNSAGTNSPGFTSQSATLQLTRRLTRRLSMSVSGGPQWSSIDSGGSQGVNLAASASLSYDGQFSHVSIFYSRGTNSGSGVIGGALSQGGGISAGRTFARVWNCAANASYTQSSSLPFASVAPVSFETAVASVQASRAIMRSLSAYASYTIEHQSSPSTTSAVDVFTGLEQVVGFGLTYSPSSIHLGRQ